MSRWIASVCVVLLVAMGPATSRSLMTKDFKIGNSRPSRLALIPASSEFYKGKVIVTEQRFDESRALELEAQRWIPEHLSELGYDVVVVTQDEIDADPELADLVRRVRIRYDEEFSKIFKQVKKGRVDFGDDGRLLAARLRVDTVLVPKIRAESSSAGKQTVGYLLGGIAGGLATRSTVGMYIVTVSGKTGKVDSLHWGQDLCRSKAMIEKPETVMRKVSASTMRSFPKANGNKR